MHSGIASRTPVALLAFLLTSHTVTARQAPSGSNDYTPKAGQPGKDVVWVPTPEGLVDRMLELARVGPEDVVVDLGSGDGRTVIRAAEKFGARGLGIEFNPDLVALSRRNAERAGVADAVDFVEADLFESDFSQATVVTLYLTPGLNLKLRSKLLDMRPGTRVVSHDFRMAAWQPDERATFEGRDAYLWFVPAKIAGTWRLTLPAGDGAQTWILALEQRFQTLSGRVRPFGVEGWHDVIGNLRGAAIELQFIDADGSLRELSGGILGDRMEGTVVTENGSTLSWHAVRERR